MSQFSLAPHSLYEISINLLVSTTQRVALLFPSSNRPQTSFAYKTPMNIYSPVYLSMCMKPNCNSTGEASEQARNQLGTPGVAMSNAFFRGGTCAPLVTGLHQSDIQIPQRVSDIDQIPAKITIFLKQIRFLLSYCKFLVDKCRSWEDLWAVLFNLFVFVETLIYFRVCHETPMNKNIKNTNYF